MSTLPEILKVTEAAAWLKVHPSSIYRMLRMGVIPAFKVGSDWRFDSSKLGEWSERWDGRRS